MAGFFRRVASAFVEIEGSGDAAAGKDQKRPGDANLDQITRGASELLAQLETVRAAEAGGPEPTQLGSDRPATAPPTDSVMALTADQVFSAASIAEGPHSASRVLKIIAGLSMFTPEQQVIMVRAMDQADDTWSEDQVLEDARGRQSLLRSHLQAVEDERLARIQDLDGRKQSTQNQGQQFLQEIEQKMAELQAQREAAIADTSAAVTRFDEQKREVEEQAEKARRGITHVINALSGLISFFAAGGSTEPEKSGGGQRRGKEG